MNKITDIEREFLLESNKIEREYSDEALEDAIIAWNYAKSEFKKSKGKLSIPFILGIHERLLRRLAPHYAGQIRDCPVYIGGECRNQSREEIVMELTELCNMWDKKKEILKSKAKRKQDREEFTKRWHILYEFCHKACDGNGRTGRILWNLQRLYLGLNILIIHEGLEQTNYYKIFKRKKAFLWKYQQEKIIKDYNNGKGKSVRQIAKYMQLNHQLVSNLLKRNGVKVLIQWNNAPSGKRHNRWKGGIRYIGKYKHIKMLGHNLARADGYVPEHRLLMQEKLGRPLSKEEVVHHADGNPLNNDISNLKLYLNNGVHKSEDSKKRKRTKLGTFK
jgi:fido (protein-threonine AMPylation protein)